MLSTLRPRDMSEGQAALLLLTTHHSAKVGASPALGNMAVIFAQVGALRTGAGVLESHSTLCCY